MNENLKKEFVSRCNLQKSIVLDACEAFLEGRISLVKAATMVVTSDPKCQESFTFIYPETEILDTIIEEHDVYGVDEKEIEARYSSEANLVFKFLKDEFTKMKIVMGSNLT